MKVVGRSNPLQRIFTPADMCKHCPVQVTRCPVQVKNCPVQVTNCPVQVTNCSVHVTNCFRPVHKPLDPLYNAGPPIIPLIAFNFIDRL